MDISWTWLVVGLVLGAPLWSALPAWVARRKVEEARSEGCRRGREHERELWEIRQRRQEQRWEDREANWTAMVLDLSAAVEKFSPARMAACSPEIERTLTAVDLGQKGE